MNSGPLGALLLAASVPGSLSAPIPGLVSAPMPAPGSAPTPSPTPTPTPTGTQVFDPGGVAPLCGIPLSQFILAAPGAPTSTGGIFGADYFTTTYWDPEYFPSTPISSIPVAPAPQLFREALTAKLYSSASLDALVGDRIYYGALPTTYEPTRDGDAITYFVVGRPMGHHLGGSDGTATARVQISAWSYRMGHSDRIAEAVRNLLDGPQGAWGDGTVKVLSVVQEDEVDLFEEPHAGTDQWTYQIASDFSIKHRVSIPTLV